MDGVVHLQTIRAANGETDCVGRVNRGVSKLIFQFAENKISSEVDVDATLESGSSDFVSVVSL